jgi:transcriptional regulator with XRE-family HTH domain
VDLRKEFPKRLRFVREMRELSQSDLAKMTGMEPSAIAHAEAGRRMPGAETLRALCKALVCSADYLLGLSERVIR